MRGIDVSYAQGKIDWEKVKAAGIGFAFIRIGYGRELSQKDEWFEENYAGAKTAGIPIGGYHYSYAVDADGAMREAKACLEMIEGKTFELAIAYDIEEARQFALPPETLYSMYKTFAGHMEADGRSCMLYTNKNWLVNKWDKTTLPDDGVKVWMAQYNRTMTYEGKTPVSIWQNSSDGAVDGIRGRVDTNESLVDLSEILAVQTGWKKDAAGRWRYYLSDGTFVQGAWQKIDGIWYHFDADGYMQTGWLSDKDEWYYLKENGAMAENELLTIVSAEHGAERYAFAGDGHMLKTEERGNLV